MYIFAVLLHKAPRCSRSLGEHQQVRRVGAIPALGGDKDQTHSPEAHQNLAGFSPKLCSGAHQKGCDLEGVKGAAPPTQLTQSLIQNMTEQNIQDQIYEMTNDELELVVAGWIPPLIGNRY